MMWTVWAAPVVAFVVCGLTLGWLLRPGRQLPMDHPNARSLHESPTPRVGGVGIMAGLIAATVTISDVSVLPFALPALALAALSLADDMRGLSVKLRFLVHFVAAAGCLIALGIHGWVLVPAVLAVVWMTNLYNFMDGADGLAGGMATIGFSALALAAWLGGAPELFAFAASVAVAALAFLHFNFPPARVFMGDAGSIPLGFLAAVLGAVGVVDGVWSWGFPLVVFSPFIVDASVTLARRALRGEKVWQAHRSHYYQRVVLLGASHRELAVAAYGLMLAMGALAFTLVVRPEQNGAVLAVAAAVYLIVFVAVDRRCARSLNEL